MTDGNGTPYLGRTNTTDLPEVLAEILKRIDELHDTQGSQITRIQQEMTSWREVNQTLTELLHTKTGVTQEVSSSYVKLAEHLAKFSNHLMMSEMTWSRVEPLLLSLSKTLPPLSESSGVPQMAAVPQGSQGEIQSLLEALTEVKEANQQMQAGMKQLLHLHRGKKETSIWTDLANWRSALFWFGMGSVFVAGMMYVVFRGSGFQQAARAVNLQGRMVEARLERIEIWLGIQGVDDEAPEFEEQDMPQE